jgi:hypothetical protein
VRLPLAAETNSTQTKTSEEASVPRTVVHNLDYATFLRELDRLDPDTPLMLEHLKTPDDHHLAANHIRSVAFEAANAYTLPRQAETSSGRVVVARQMEVSQAP